MPDIANLNLVSNLSVSDQIPVQSAGTGDARRVSIGVLLALLQANLTLPNGILTGAALYGMRQPTPGPFAPVIGLTYAAIPGMDKNRSVAQPAGAIALSPVEANGYWIATRDIKAAVFNVNFQATFANPRVLTLAAQVIDATTGTYTTPLAMAYTGAGATPVFGNFTGVIYNPNNANGVIAKGDIVQLSAKIDTGAAVTFADLFTQIQTLDGL